MQDHGLEGTRPPCPICPAHPGWAHDDERARRDSRDCCAACLGSGVVQPLDAARLLQSSARLALQAQAALDDEHEGDFTLAVKRLANRSAALSHLVRTW